LIGEAKEVSSGKGGVKGQMNAPDTDANQSAEFEKVGADGADSRALVSKEVMNA
jgi:hypothetical protein